MFGVLTPLQTMQPVPIYRRVEIFKKSSIFAGSTLEMDMHCFSFVMMYGLSSDNILYSTSNQFLYVNKTLLHFLNIKQEFSFMNWFLCLCHVSLGQHWGKWNKKMSKTSNIPYVQAIYVVVYRRGGLKLLYTILWTIVLWTRFHMYSTSFFFFYLLLRCTVVDFWTII